MKASKRAVLTAALCGIATQAAQAAGESGYVTIVSTAMSISLGNNVQIRVSAPPTTPASCSTNTTWHFSLSLDSAAGRNLYALIIAAKAAGTTVWISGANACSEIGNIESLRAITTYEAGS
jgi:hypothetical protein